MLENKYKEIRQEVFDVTMSLFRGGFITASSGNLSSRISGTDFIAITPSGRRYDQMSPDDIVIIDEQGNKVDGLYAPSSETPMHTLIYREMKEIQAVIHTHSPYAITHAVLGESLPMICIEGLNAGASEVLITERFEIPGTVRFAEEVLKTLRKQPGSKAVLLASHGLLVTGKSIYEAASLAESLEIEAQVHYQARLLGTPEIFSEAARQEIIRHYQAYKEEK